MTPIEEYLEKAFSKESFKNLRQRKAFCQKKGIKIQVDDDGRTCVAVFIEKKMFTGSEQSTSRVQEDKWADKEDHLG